MGMLRRFVVAAIGSLGASAAFAADLPGPEPAAPAPVVAAPAPAPSGWIVTLGAEGRVIPGWDGAPLDHIAFSGFPLIDIRRAGTPPRFFSAHDSFGISLLDLGNLHVGPIGKLRFPRRESAFAELQGLGDVGYAVELGGFAEYWFTPWLRARAEVRQGFGGHHGIVSDVSGDLVVPLGKAVLSGGPRLTLATAAALDPYFSITPAQSAATGLPVFDAKGGVRSYGAGAQARVFWSKEWATHVFAEYERLTGDAAHSPLVVQRGSVDQLTYGAGLTYSFETAGF